MDSVIDSIVDFCQFIRTAELPEKVRTAAVQRIVDAAGCALGAGDSEAATIARSVAATVTSGPYAARAIGDPAVSMSWDAAAFLNTAMIRNLDFNDTYPGGHPSDSLGALFAVADATGASGDELIRGLVASYEVFVRTVREMKLREKGWDQALNVALAATAGACVLLRLDRVATRHALSIATVADNALRNTRSGELSMWKGLATAFATRDALFATMLAAKGATGPEAPIEGRHGLIEQVTGAFTFDHFPDRGGVYWTPSVRIKYWPVEYNLQAAVFAAQQLHGQIEPERVASVRIETYWSGWHETASEPEKWNPQTRETADHSLPYVFAWSFNHNGLEPHAFEPQEFLDDRYRTLMKNTTVTVADDIEEAFPDHVILRAHVVDDTGAETTVEIRDPRGHELNPMTDQQIDQKFVSLTQPVLGEQGSADAVSGLRGISTVNSLRDLLDLLVAR